MAPGIAFTTTSSKIPHSPPSHADTPAPKISRVLSHAASATAAARSSEIQPLMVIPMDLDIHPRSNLPARGPLYLPRVDTRLNNLPSQVHGHAHTHGPMQRSSDAPFYAQARAHTPACCSSDHITFVVNPSATSSRRLERVTHNSVTTVNINYRNLTISYACCAVLLNKSRYQVVSRAFDLASSITIGHLPTLAKLISTFTRCFTLITFASNVRFPLGIVTAKEVDQDCDNLKDSNTEQDVRLLHPQDPERNGVTRATHLVRVEYFNRARAHWDSEN